MPSPTPTILVGVGDGIDETSYGWLWHFLTRDLNAPFVPVALRRIGGMDDLAHYNVLFLPDGSPSRMRRELGDDGIAKLRSEEHTSELQSRRDLVCRLLLE